jgi:hypothetical protein
VNGVDKSFQQKQGAPDDIGKQTEEPPQLMSDSQAEEVARRRAEVENMRRKVEETMRKAGKKTKSRWSAEVQKRVDEDWEARVAELEAEAEDAKCKAEVAKFVVLEASGLEKAAASDVARAACRTASEARYMVELARVEAEEAAARSGI